MKKIRFLSVMLTLAMLLCLLTGCACKHEWVDANCNAPKTCTLCGETEGEKTDSHLWEDATTEAPKTCSVCGKTEGEKINVDPRFKTANCKELFGTWKATYEADAASMGLTGDLVVSMALTMKFTNDGKMELTSELVDPDTFRATFVDYLVTLMYQQFASQGMNKTQADAACKQVYGMGVTDFCTKTAKESIKNMSSTIKMVYYAEGGKIYAADSWTDEMDPEGYEFKDGKLLLDDSDLGKVITFSRETE